MIQLPHRDLPNAAQKQLDAWQNEINGLSTYIQQVTQAKRQFSSRNVKGNATFDTVKVTLTTMCSGARRCCYCEDSAADEVEHIKPKDLYPEVVFAWSNYLYACGPCNVAKINRFAVLKPRSSVLVDVTRERNAPVTPPKSGDPALIDPRQEDPLHFLELDLVSTFYFLPADGLTKREQSRAEYTIDLLGLNKRDFLTVARAGAFRSYRAHLVEYIHRRDEGFSTSQLQDLVHGLRGMGHPTVWKEMQRQRQWHSELKALFAQAPEALNW